ncbi:dihydroorotase [Tenuifilum thalassicum]|uniref:Dihydroorotase n=1 Tax=Tenuifilum thalassicum TaxID=2590900 RepID=A0A7D3XDI7_9BACT|nr:dihydroorotase [Tenuifilum thalassicum]QKG79127.1 dihydroorotase [Tenuifilum thalassicum]
MARFAITNATIVNEGKRLKGFVIVNGKYIEKIGHAGEDFNKYAPEEIIDASNLLLIPGVIDDQVHFREPGLTHKGDIYTESKAAIAGGVTSYMEMPNTKPQSVTLENLNEKFKIAQEKSLANYSFYFGATNDNIEELIKIDPNKVCGVKVFMGSSTGNMLVDDDEALEKIFKHAPTIITTHCEDEGTIRKNLEHYKSLFGDNIDFKYHSTIRSTDACYLSSSKAVRLAKKHDARLHILHLSTKKELELLDNEIPLAEKKITGEVCVHHLWFNDADYDKLGWRIKWNPSIKTEEDRLALVNALKNNVLDVVATDHAPHLVSEKDNVYTKSASGGPLVQHSLIAMLEMSLKGNFSLEKVVEKMCHAPATLYRIEKRGFIREGYYADLVLVAPDKQYVVNRDNILYKCSWSPFEGYIFNHSVEMTIVNGRIVYNKGSFDESTKGESLSFNS